MELTCFRVLCRAHDAEDVASPELCQVRLIVSAQQQLRGNTKAARRADPAVDASAAVEILRQADMVDVGNIHCRLASAIVDEAENALSERKIVFNSHPISPEDDALRILSRHPVATKVLHRTAPRTTVL